MACSPPPTPRIGALLLIVLQWVREETFAGVRAAGYGDVNSAHLAMLHHPTLDGLRPIEIAGRMQITRQSVHELLARMEEHGYLTREADAANGRTRVVRLTATGRRLELEIRAQAGAAEAHIAALLGDQRFTQLRDGLLELAEGITTAHRVRRPTP